MASRCTAAIWRAGRLASLQAARPSAAALQEAATPHGTAGSLAQQQLAGGGTGRSLLPACAQGLADSRGQRRWAQAKVDKKEAAKAAATGAMEGNLNAKMQSMLKVCQLETEATMHHSAGSPP